MSDDDFHITDVLPMFREETDDMSDDQDTFCSSERPSIDREQTPHAPYGMIDNPANYRTSDFKRGVRRAVLDHLPESFRGWSESHLELFERALDLVEKAVDAPSGLQILDELFEIGSTLLDKNRRYGDSALEPIGIMSDGDPVRDIDVRLDDKFSRLKEGAADDPEDVLLDIMGYIVLRRVAVRRRRD